MKYFIIAGERSGDLHGSYLVAALKRRDPKAEIVGYGGDLMQAEGMRILSHYKEGAFMGFVEVLLNLNSIFSRMRRCKVAIREFQPDVVVLIDYPGFNLGVAEFAKKIGIRTSYYISPKIWAWNRSRIHKIRKYIDRMLVIFPFEVPFYDTLDYSVTYVGNPLIEQIQDADPRPIAQLLPSYKTRIAFLPGSRQQEVKSSLPRIIDLARNKPEWGILVTAVDNLSPNLYDSLKGYSNITVVTGQTHEALMSADAAVVTSGTATLEAALLGTPQVVCYQANPISYAIGKRLVKLKYISLVNLIADDLVVKELIQAEYTVENVIAELEKLLPGGTQRDGMLTKYEEVHQMLGNLKASDEAAKNILGLVDD